MRAFTVVAVLVLFAAHVAGKVQFKDLSGDYERVLGGLPFCTEHLTVKVKNKRLNEVRFRDGKQPCTIQSRSLKRGQLGKKNEFRDKLGIGVRTAAPLACSAGMFVTMELYRPSETFDLKVGAMAPIRQKEDVKYLHFVREDAAELCVYQEQGDRPSGGEERSPSPRPSPSRSRERGSRPNTPKISRPSPSPSRSPSSSRSPAPSQSPSPSIAQSPTASSSPRSSISASPSSALAESNSTSVLSPDTPQNATSTNAQPGSSVFVWVGPLLAALAAIVLIAVGVYCVTYSE